MKALLLVDHGSTLADANRLLDDVAARIRAKGGYGVVQAAHMDLASPTVAEAFDACVAAGATEVTVAQWFLSPGRHSTKDIPALVKAAARRHAAVRWRVAEPLGLSEKAIEALLERAREAEGWR